MSASFTPGVTVTEKINEDGSKTVTTVTIHEDGSKSTKRKTIRPKKKVGGASRSPSPKPVARTKKPTSGNGGSMEDALEDALDGPGHKDDEEFEKAVRRCIPSDFTLIASQDDLTQAQEAFHAATLFDLPNPAGEAGSVATSALLQFLYQKDKHVNGGASPLSCLEVVQEMETRMTKATKSKFVLHPQISSSRPLGPPRLPSKTYAPFYIVPPNNNSGEGRTRRALLIGINFIDDEESKRLKGAHNDVHNVQLYLTEKCGFDNSNIVVLRDTAKDQDPATAPTKKNIMDGFQKMVDMSKPGDVVFIQYSGHGGRVNDLFNEGDDSVFDSYILPSDYKTAGQILDDDILRYLIKAMRAGVSTTMLVDCCNSGTVGDLPYLLKANTTRDQEIEKFFDTATLSEIHELEAKSVREQEEYKRAKAERKKQRELQKIQQEKDKAAAQAQAEKDADALAQKLVGLNAGGGAGAPPQMMMTTMPAGGAAPPKMETFNVKSEEEVAALTKKYGVALQLSPEQKACLQQGGTVTLSFQTQQQPQMMTMMAPQQHQQQGGMIMMTPEQAEAFKKANGGRLVMTPEQAAMFMQQPQQQ